jgi:hypothetical protein
VTKRRYCTQHNTTHQTHEAYINEKKHEEYGHNWILKVLWWGGKNTQLGSAELSVVYVHYRDFFFDAED